MCIDPYESRDSYFQDVVMQMFTKKYADMYNQYQPPKLVDFVKAWIIELVDRPQVYSPSTFLCHTLSFHFNLHMFIEITLNIYVLSSPFIYVHIIHLCCFSIYIQRPLAAVEHFITGAYRKHNNNFGYVDEDERNTPQAFSHFTYEASNHQLLVCDIQGVGNNHSNTNYHYSYILPCISIHSLLTQFESYTLICLCVDFNIL